MMQHDNYGQLLPARYEKYKDGPWGVLRSEVSKIALITWDLCWLENSTYKFKNKLRPFVYRHIRPPLNNEL